MIRIIKADELSDRDFITRGEPSRELADTVSKILADVYERGDAAVREYTSKFDGCELDAFEVSQEELDAAAGAAGSEFAAVMERAAHNIEEFHRRQVRGGFIMTPGNGIVLGQRILPVERAGLYIPGGTAAYPSSVLMNCIPAKIAGVRNIIMVTPPLRNGSVNPGILAAAKTAGVDRIFKIGGAQAVAALAYGTETIPRVDKITGPGNAFVAEAKRQVFGIVGIDMIAGPSDILIIADNTASPVHAAADMLSQCEHGELSRAVLITDSPKLAENVAEEIERQLNELPRYKIARASIDGGGRIIIAGSLEQAFEISNSFAPEHLEILLDEPFKYLDLVRNAGSVFLGKSTPEALGDYYAGPNHTLPTSGTARFSSPLSVDDFIKKSSFTYYPPETLALAAGDISLFAEKEGLYAHAQSVLKRTDLS